MAWYTGTTSGDHYLDLLDRLEKIMTSNSITTIASIVAGGSSYVVGDELTVSGGTFSPSAAKIRVTGVSGGAVTTAVISEGGAYTVDPTGTLSTTGGTGTGCTITATFTSNGWTNNMDNTPSGEREIWFEGTGAGSDEIHVGIKTFNALSQGGIDQAYNWGICAATGHNGGLDWWEQPGISPGFDSIGDPDTDGGAFVPLKTTDASYPIDYWISVTPRRIKGAMKMENGSIIHYSSFYAGFMNQFGTSTEYPYPIYTGGSSYRYNTFFEDTAPRYTGISEAMGSNSLVGPGFYRTFDDLWISVKNSSANDGGSPSRVAAENYTMYPSSKTSSAAIDSNYDRIVSDASGFNWNDIIPSSGIPGTPTYRLEPTPNTGDDLYSLIPCTIVASKTDGGRNDLDVLGELDGVFWISGGGTPAPTSEDYVDIGDVRYRIFQNGNRSETFSLMAMEEN